MADDIALQVLAAIEQAEQDARADIDHFDDVPEPKDPRDQYIVKLANGTLHRCVVDRRRLERHQPETATDGRYEGELICAGCSVGDDDWFDRPFPCPDFLDLADSYGVAPATEPADQQGAT